MARLSQVGELRYSLLFGAVVLVVVIAWNAVAKLVAEWAILPLVRLEATAAGPLHVTNNDGSLSNGDRLRGWDNAAYFGTHVGLWMAGCTAAFVALVRVWPANAPSDHPPPQNGGAGSIPGTL